MAAKELLDILTKAFYFVSHYNKSSQYTRIAKLSYYSFSLFAVAS